MIRTRHPLSVFLGILGFSLALAASTTPSDPIYIRTTSGWFGLFSHADEYAEYSLSGPSVKLQDPYHILLKPQLGLMVSFVDKSKFGGSGDILSLHADWELAYWQQHAAKAESSVRNDLSGGRSDLRVTEIRLQNTAGAQMKVYVIALVAKEGVFVLALSPADANIDALASEIAGSFKLVHRQLDGEEVKRLSLEASGRS